MLTLTHVAAGSLLMLSCTIFINKISLMSMLICLELLMFTLLCFVMHTVMPLYVSTTLLALLMCFAVSGAAIGLTLLVSMSRQFGNDKISNF